MEIYMQILAFTKKLQFWTICTCVYLDTIARILLTLRITHPHKHKHTKTSAYVAASVSCSCCGCANAVQLDLLVRCHVVSIPPAGPQNFIDRLNYARRCAIYTHFTMWMSTRAQLPYPGASTKRAIHLTVAFNKTLCRRVAYKWCDKIRSVREPDHLK